MDPQELRTDLLYEVSGLSARQLLMEEPEDALRVMTRAESFLGQAHNRKERIYGWGFRMSGLPCRIVATGVAHGRLKNGVQIEAEYDTPRYEIREGGIVWQRDADGSQIYDTFTFEAVVRPSQVHRTWAETELAHTMAEMDRAAGVERIMHWYTDCPAIRAPDAVFRDWDESGYSGRLCDACRERSVAKSSAARMKRKLKPEQERLLRHVEIMLAEGVVNADEAGWIRDRHFAMFRGSGPRGGRWYYMFGWLDGRGLD